LSGTSSSIRTKLWWNSHWMVLFQNCARQSRSPTKMAATVPLRCYWKQLWSMWASTGSWEPQVESVNVFVLPRFDLSTCSSSTNNLTNSHMRKRFPEWVRHCQVVWILRGSTLKFYWIQENQTAMYFLRSMLFTYDIMKNFNCN
jgi:hypothetical protein